MTTTGVVLQLCCIVVKPNPSLKRKFANGLTLISQNGNCRIKPSFHNICFCMAHVGRPGGNMLHVLLSPT